MRTKLNLDNSLDTSVAGSRSSSQSNCNDRRIADKLAISGLPLSTLPLPSMPLEWLGAGSWRLPSGKALAEFAFEAGFLAPLLFNGERFGGTGRASGGFESERTVGSRAKQCAKGSGQ